MSDEAELGTCTLCGQEMVLTADDCWHPWNVDEACPPGGSGRPGRQYWRPRKVTDSLTIRERAIIRKHHENTPVAKYRPGPQGRARLT